MPTSWIACDGTQVDVARVAARLVRLWLPSFAKLRWKGRLDLLEQIDATLAKDIADDMTRRRVSQKFTAEILQRIAMDVVTGRDQALLLLNSEDERHREAARTWLVLNRVDSGLTGQSESDARNDKRLATRYNVNLPGIIADDETLAMGHLVDISATGAKVEVFSAPPSSKQVFLEFPLVGRVMATVVRVAASFVALTFAVDTAAPAKPAAASCGAPLVRACSGIMSPPNPVMPANAGIQSP